MVLHLKMLIMGHVAFLKTVIYNVHCNSVVVFMHTSIGHTVTNIYCLCAGYIRENMAMVNVLVAG